MAAQLTELDPEHPPFDVHDPVALAVKPDLDPPGPGRRAGRERERGSQQLSPDNSPAARHLGHHRLSCAEKPRGAVRTGQ